MADRGTVLSAKGGFLTQTFRSSGPIACMRKIASAIRMSAPLVLLRRRTNRSVGAYFDLITDDARMFYDDNFHFGFFHEGAATLRDGIEAHTDMVAEMARLGGASRVLDIGCGICAPAIRIARRYACHITGINISREQVRQGRKLVESSGLSDRIRVLHGNALNLDFEDGSFDSILCIEVAGDICVTDAQKETLLGEMHRVLKPGGHVGFSDLVFTAPPSDEEEAIMRAILYHEGRELITDWPGLFVRSGFCIAKCSDMIEHTHATWDHSLAVYEKRCDEVEGRYGKRIARRTMDALERIPGIMKRYGSFVVLSAKKPC